MKNLLLIFILSIILCGCKYGTDFSVQNKTNSQIDSLIISNGFNSTSSKKIDPNKTLTFHLDFKKNNSKRDGNFLIKYKYKNKNKNDIFGYYSNGIPTSESVFIQIYNDTIIIKEEF